MPKQKAKSPKTKKSTVLRKAHKWRPCPLGQHWVSAHSKNKTSKQGRPYVQNVKGFCRINPSHLDHLCPDDIHEVASQHFSKLKGPPTLDSFTPKGKGNQYDSLIRG